MTETRYVPSISSTPVHRQFFKRQKMYNAKIEIAQMLYFMGSI